MTCHIIGIPRPFLPAQIWDLSSVEKGVGGGAGVCMTGQCQRLRCFRVRQTKGDGSITTEQGRVSLPL